LTVVLASMSRTLAARRCSNNEIKWRMDVTVAHSIAGIAAVDAPNVGPDIASA
jgi:hypothetical protein